MRLIITAGGKLVADIPGWEGPVPRKGEYIHHPNGTEPVPGLSDGMCTVITVQWGIMARPADRRVKHFVGAAEPFAEVVLSG